MRIDNYEIDIPDLLRRWHIDDQRVLGREINAPCPWRRHKSGKYKFYINVDTGLWNCQACPDKGGGLKGLISLMEDVQSWEIGDFVRRYGREINLEGFDEYIIDLLYPDDEPIRINTIKKLREQTRKAFSISKSKLSVSYWRSRGLEDRTIRYWKLRNLTGHHTHPLIIPITVDGLPYFHARRAIDSSVKPKYLFQPGFPRKDVVFGLDKIDPNSSTVVVCEGMLDCIKVWQALRERFMLDEFSPVAIFGTRASKKQIESIATFADVAILFLDNDRAGKEGIEYFLKEKRGLWIDLVDYEDRKAGDPGDLSSEEIIDMLENARDVLSMDIRKILMDIRKELGVG